jgi:DNA-binding protein H-NS
MMNTYAKLQQQIAALKEQAEEARRAEVATVIENIKKQITLYELRPTDLFNRPLAQGRRPRPLLGGKPVPSGTVFYLDPNDPASDRFVWGKGKPKKWLRAAFNQGRAHQHLRLGKLP